MGKEDYCTWFPDTIFGIYIGNACKLHDDTCSTSKFYEALVKELKPLVFNHELAFTITAGGAIGCLVKYPRKMIKKWRIK